MLPLLAGKCSPAVVPGCLTSWCVRACARACVHVCVHVRACVRAPDVWGRGGGGVAVVLL